MPVDVAQLRTLFWIARLGSFRAAAARLSVSQPTISLRIKSWEQELGFPLFKRAGRSVAVSEDAATVLEDAERVIALLNNLDHRVASQGEVGGFLQLAAPDSFALLCLADLLSDLDRAARSSGFPSRSTTARCSSVGWSKAPSTSAFWRNSPIRAGSASIRSGGISSCGSRGRPTQAGCVWPGRDRAASHLEQSLALEHVHAAGGLVCEEALVPGRMSTCNSVAAILSLVASGAGISPLPRTVVEERIGRGALDALPVIPALPDTRIFIGSARSSTNPAVPLVAEVIKRVMKRRPFLD